jgi:hypothetical protein
LNGNWQIAGDPTDNSTPAISVTLVGNGPQITGTAIAFVQCPGVSSSLTTIVLTLNGQVDQANSGTFTAATEEDAAGDILSIRGAVPRPNQHSWTGSYSLYASPTDRAGGPGCSLQPSGSFQAIPITPLNGTFSGVLTGNNLGDNASVSVQIAQAPTITSFSGYTATASLTVSGSSCFKTGKQILATTPAIAGDFVSLYFFMDDGSEVELHGLTNAGGGKINASVLVDGGKCIYDNDSGLLQNQ